MTTVARIALAYSPFFVLAAAAAIGVLHVVFHG